MPSQTPGIDANVHATVKSIVESDFSDRELHELKERVLGAASVLDLPVLQGVEAGAPIDFNRVQGRVVGRIIDELGEDELGRRARAAHIDARGKPGRLGSADVARRQKALAFGLISLPVALSFMARLPEVLGWKPCKFEPSCEHALNYLNMLGSAFPHAFAYPAQMFTDNTFIIVAVLLTLDFGLGALVWKGLPTEPTKGQVTAIFGGWAALSVASIWVAPHLVVQTLKLILWFEEVRR